jgi:hypothetical protein
MACDKPDKVSPRIDNANGTDAVRVHQVASVV